MPSGNFYPFDFTTVSLADFIKKDNHSTFDDEGYSELHSTHKKSNRRHFDGQVECNLSHNTK